MFLNVSVIFWAQVLLGRLWLSTRSQPDKDIGHAKQLGKNESCKNRGCKPDAYATHSWDATPSRQQDSEEKVGCQSWGELFLIFICCFHCYYCCYWFVCFHQVWVWVVELVLKLTDFFCFIELHAYFLYSSLYGVLICDLKKSWKFLILYM